MSNKSERVKKKSLMKNHKNHQRSCDMSNNIEPQSKSTFRDTTNSTCIGTKSLITERQQKLKKSISTSNIIKSNNNKKGLIALKFLNQSQSSQKDFPSSPMSQQKNFESLNTIDTTNRQNQMAISTPTSQFLSNPGSARKLFESRLTKKKYLQGSKIRLENYTTIEHNRMKHSDNINLLESWIEEIKTKGFKKNNALMTTKQNMINSYEANIKALSSRVNSAKLKNNKSFISKSLTRNEHEKIVDNFNGIKKNIGQYKDEIRVLKDEISAIPQRTLAVKNLTLCYIEKANKYQREIKTTEDIVQKMNHKISDIMKEREKLLSFKTLLDKNILSTTKKIEDIKKRAQNFMINVNVLLNSGELYVNNK